MHTDASGTGFGIDCEGKKLNGLWNQDEKECQINVQELLAIKIGLDTNLRKVTTNMFMFIQILAWQLAVYQKWDLANQS